MKKILCFLGIIIILFLTLLPPILRYVMPDHDPDLEKEISTIKKILSCNNEYYSTRTSYENDVIVFIIVKKNKVIEPLEEETGDEEIEGEDTETGEIKKTVLDTDFESLKKIENITYNSLDDGDVISIDFSIYDYAKENLSSFNKNLVEQKTYYEENDLVCSIIE